MSHIIENLTTEIRNVRFSFLSENKIQLEYKVKITCVENEIYSIKLKLKFIKYGDSYWKAIPVKERLLNVLSVTNGIKKKNIKIIYHDQPVDFKINSNDYKVFNLIKSIDFDDAQFYRSIILDSLLGK
jgi:hypothetical protein